MGVAVELIPLIEEHTYESYLADENPYLDLLHCGAEHAPNFPRHLQKLLDKRSSPHATCTKKRGRDKLVLEAAKTGPVTK